MSKLLLKQLPKIDDLIQGEYLQPYIQRYGRNTIVRICRQAVSEVRKQVLSGRETLDIQLLVANVLKKKVHQLELTSLRRVINATGIVLHTNLGRAKLSEKVKEQLWQVSSSYSTLEYDIKLGSRGSRYDHVLELLKEITGAEDALVVNNNAAAVLLTLGSLCKNKEAVVSRGQLIEIGGSFRIPEVMEQSGAILHEVGATNKVHLHDYQKAINDNTGVILKVHTSNYRIFGFTQEVDTNSLVTLSHENMLPLIEDLGSGVLFDVTQFGLSYEPTVQDVVAQGVDVVTFSGDKLLGGPQAGIIVGKKQFIDKMKSNPLNRALRIDKMTLAALEGTLRLYLDKKKALDDIPTLRMLAIERNELLARASNLAKRIRTALNDTATIKVLELHSQVGGGALPTETLPSAGIAIKPKNVSVNQLEEALRLGEPPIIGRIENDHMIFDLRTVDGNDEEDMLYRQTVASLEGENR